MIRRRGLTVRLAGPISRRPLRMALGALLISALAAGGLFRLAVDPGQPVGSNSSAAQTYAAFSRTFGADPIIVAFTAVNASAPYLEQNLRRLGALEIDLAHDPRVAVVLGPGTIAASLTEAAVAEFSKVLTEYPYFFAETDYLNQISMGNTDQSALTQRVQKDINDAQAVLELYVLRAARDAIVARANYKSQSADRIIDSQEKAVDAAVAADSVPPLWAEYLAGPGQTPNPAQAQQVFNRFAAADGACITAIANLLSIPNDCQAFFERSLLDLPNCPSIGSKGVFCDPKPQWAAVLPAPQAGGATYMILSVRLKPQFAADRGELTSLRDKINRELSHGIADDAYTRSLNATSLTTLRALGPLHPTECAGQTATQNSACAKAFKDAVMSTVIAGSPLLAAAAVDSMQQLLIILVPAALLVLLLLLIGTGRVRGRAWALPAALAAAAITLGLAVLGGMRVTPTVLAGIPLLLGLSAAYSVQLVSRFTEERDTGTDLESALRAALRGTGGSMLIAAFAALFGLAALTLLAGIDWGPLVAVPPAAELGLLLGGGIAAAWFAAVFVALPLAVHTDRRRGSPTEVRSDPKPQQPEPAAAARTLAVADNWIGVVAPLAVLALAGWALLHVVPVQTDNQAFVNQGLSELSTVQEVQAETGYANAVDIYVRGNVVTGAVDAQTGTPTTVEWQCQAARDILTGHSGAVTQAVSIGDFFIGSGTATSGSSVPSCVSNGRGTPSPSPSPGSSPTPTASPAAVRNGSPGAIPVSRRVAGETAATASPAPSGSATASPSTALPSSSAGATPTASPPPRNGKPAVTQTIFLCDLRLLPLLSRSLVMDIGPDTPPCPAVDAYRRTFLATDSAPIDPTASRIALGVSAVSVADEARLVGSLHSEVARAPDGLVATPTGLAVLATTAHDDLVGRAYLLDLAPLAAVALALLLAYHNTRRTLLLLLPATLASGWTPLVVLLLGRLPGGVGTTLGSLNPLNIGLSAVVAALTTGLGAVLLGRFDDGRRDGLATDAAAAKALEAARRTVLAPAALLGGGLMVLGLSGFFPGGTPLLAGFGLLGVIEVALAVAAIFLVMLPLTIALERRRAAVLTVPEAPATGTAPDEARLRPGVSGRRRPARDEAAPRQPARRPGVSGRRRPGR